MEQLKKFFPLSASCTDKEIFIRNLIIYIVAMVVFGLVISLLGRIPIIGIIAGIVGAICGIYFVIGIVLAVLIYLNIIK